jgi:Methyltransferase domain
MIMTKEQYTIDEFVFIGRTFAEYLQMFDLMGKSMGDQQILDCPAGPCSFVAEARAHGIDAVGADILYNHSSAALTERATDDISRAMSALDGVEHLYRWEFYDDIADLRTYRERAATQFLQDYSTNDERYIHAELPQLPFDDGAFDLVLSAHFLFLYDDRFSLTFHLDTIREFVRVGGQLRIFPLHGFNGEQSELVGDVVDALRADGYDVRLETVPFEFQCGADQMLVVE